MPHRRHPGATPPVDVVAAAQPEDSSFLPEFWNFKIDENNVPDGYVLPVLARAEVVFYALNLEAP